MLKKHPKNQCRSMLTALYLSPTIRPDYTPKPYHRTLPLYQTASQNHTTVPHHTTKPYHCTTPYPKAVPQNFISWYLFVESGRRKCTPKPYPENRTPKTVPQNRTPEPYPENRTLKNRTPKPYPRTFLYPKNRTPNKDVYRCTVLGYGFGVRFFRVRFSGYGSGVRFWGTVFGVRFWSTVLGYGTVQWYCRVLSIGTLPTLRKNTSFFWYTVSETVLGYGFGARYGRVVRYVGTVLGYCTVQAYSGIVWSCSTPIQTLRISC